MTALVLVSLLPWCGFNAVSAAAAGVAATATIRVETAENVRIDLSDVSIKELRKKKPTAFVHQAQCSVNAPVSSGLDYLLSVSEGTDFYSGETHFTQRCAQSPPTKPPRSV